MGPRDREEIREHLPEGREKLARELPSLREAAKPVPPDRALGRITRLDAIRRPGLGSYPEAGMGSMVVSRSENYSPENVAWIEALFPKRRP